MMLIKIDIIQNIINMKGDWSNGPGHFTQMILKDTKEVGFGKFRDRSRPTYIVGNYYPVGNIIFYFRNNVLMP